MQSVEAPPPGRILNSVRRIVHFLRKSSRATEKLLGISSAQLFVLQQLAGAAGGGRRGYLTVNELARLTFTHQSSVSTVVARLERHGLVSRRTSRADARKVEVGLTAAGRALLRKAPASLQERLIRGILKLRPSDQLRLALLLENIIEKSDLTGEPASFLFEDRL